jgi:hypothetical protein
LMNIPFIKNIIEENRIEAEGFWLDRRYCNEGNEYVGKKNIVLTIIMLNLTAKPNTDTDPDVIIKVEKYRGGWRCDSWSILLIILR